MISLTPMSRSIVAGLIGVTPSCWHVLCEFNALYAITPLTIHASTCQPVSTMLN